MTEQQVQTLARAIVETRGQYEEAVRANLRYILAAAAHIHRLKRRRLDGREVVSISYILLPMIRRLEARDVKNFLADEARGEQIDALFTHSHKLMESLISSGQLTEALTSDLAMKDARRALDRMTQDLERPDTNLAVLVAFRIMDWLLLLSRNVDCGRFDAIVQDTQACIYPHAHRFLRYKDILLPAHVGAVSPQIDLSDPRKGLDFLCEFVEAVQLENKSESASR